MYCSSNEKAVCYVVTFLVFNVLGFSTASENSDLRKTGNIDRRSSEDEYRGVMWFGPRLGKRSLAPAPGEDSQAWRRLIEAADAVRFYYGQLQDEEPEISVMKKYLFTPKLGRSVEERKAYSGSVDFTPRLGRTLAGEYARAKSADRDGFRVEVDPLEARPPLFSPRLGRSTVHFSPRMGRDLYYDMANADDDGVRVARSATHKDKPTST